MHKPLSISHFAEYHRDPIDDDHKFVMISFIGLNDTETEDHVYSDNCALSKPFPTCFP